MTHSDRQMCREIVANLAYRYAQCPSEKIKREATQFLLGYSHGTPKAARRLLNSPIRNNELYSYRRDIWHCLGVSNHDSVLHMYADEYPPPPRILAAMILSGIPAPTYNVLTRKHRNAL